MAIKRDAADRNFSLAVRTRDRFTCQYCGKDGTDAAHIYSRRSKVVRWSMDNALCLCRYHHQYFESNPVAFTDFLTSHLGEEHMDRLRVKAQGHMKTTKALRLEISAHYRQELARRGADPTYQMQSYN